MEIHRYTERDQSRWESFVTTANNGTIFHRQRFLSYHPPERFTNHHLMFLEKDVVLGLFPAALDGTALISHRGASYGGFVLKPDLGIHQVYLMVGHLIAHLKTEGIRQVTLTQTPLVYYRIPDQYVDFALLKHGFRYRKREITAVIPLDLGDPLASFHADARRSVKKAVRDGVRVSVSDDYAGYYEILEKNLGMRHNVKPTHTLTELRRLRDLFPDEIVLFGVYLKDKLIGGMVVFVANPAVLLAFYISHDTRFQSHRPVNLLFYEVIRWGRRRGFKYLDLGTFTLNMEPNWGLGRFKENFNARGYLRDTLELTLQ